MEQTKTYRMLWQKRTDGGARLIRLYGSDGQISLPQQIEGHPLLEIAPYCFAKSKQSDEKERFEETIIGDRSEVPFLQELSQDKIWEVYLPDSVQKIGNCAFYNCKNLKTLQIGVALTDIGSDAFMNTLSFRQIILCCPPDEESAVAQILSQISSSIEIRFQTKQTTLAVLLYPEYYESYDEIAPAHLFGRKIRGEGFRARKCIKDKKVDFGGYDDIFLQACVEESEETLTKMAMNRLNYPYALRDKSRENYMDYIRKNGPEIAMRLTRQKDLKALQFLFHADILSDADLAKCIRIASEGDWPEGAAVLLQQSALGRTKKKNRYDFDAF